MFITMELGQVGTQFDAFPHQMIANRMYNCVKLEEVETRTGFTKLGVDKVGMIFTRGVLIDIAALKGVEMLDATYEVTAADLQQALAAQKLTLQPGDAVIELAAKRVHEFAFTMQPLKIRGGTGSTVAPAAIR